MTEAVASSAVITAEELDAALVICFTETGTTSRLMSKYRPQCPIFAITAAPDTARICSGLSRGVHAMTMRKVGEESIHVLRSAGKAHDAAVQQVLRRTLREANNLGFCDVSDFVIIIQGQAMDGVSAKHDPNAHATNTMEVHMISEADLADPEDAES